MGCMNNLPNKEFTGCDMNWEGHDYEFEDGWLIRDGLPFAEITETIEENGKIIQAKAKIKCGNMYMDGTEIIMKLRNPQ
jgi:hypothetical protein